MISHWFTSPDPPKFGEDLVALCGDVVPKAQPIPAMWGPEGGLVTCQECPRHSTRGATYLAVIQSGEESIEHG